MNSVVCCKRTVQPLGNMWKLDGIGSWDLTMKSEPRCGRAGCVEVLADLGDQQADGLQDPKDICWRVLVGLDSWWWSEPKRKMTFNQLWWCGTMTLEESEFRTFIGLRTEFGDEGHFVVPVFLTRSEAVFTIQSTCGFCSHGHRGPPVHKRRRSFRDGYAASFICPPPLLQVCCDSCHLVLLFLAVHPDGCYAGTIQCSVAGWVTVRC